MHYPQIQPHWGLGFQFINFGANMIKYSVGYNYLQDSVLTKSAKKSLKFMETVAAFFCHHFLGDGGTPCLGERSISITWVRQVIPSLYSWICSSRGGTCCPHVEIRMRISVLSLGLSITIFCIYNENVKYLQGSSLWYIEKAVQLFVCSPLHVPSCCVTWQYDLHCLAKHTWIKVMLVTLICKC